MLQKPANGGIPTYENIVMQKVIAEIGFILARAYLKAVQLIDPGLVRLSSERRSSWASLTLRSSSEAMFADKVGDLGQSLYRPDLQNRILFICIVMLLFHTQILVCLLSPSSYYSR